MKYLAQRADVAQTEIVLHIHVPVPDQPGLDALSSLDTLGTHSIVTDSLHPDLSLPGLPLLRQGAGVAPADEVLHVQPGQGGEGECGEEEGDGRVVHVTVRAVLSSVLVQSSNILLRME